MEDVLVLGGGVIGLWSALELSRRGRSVTLIDAGPEVPSASWAGGGILSPLFAWRYPDAVTRLTDAAVPRYRQLVREVGEAGGEPPELDEVGLLVAMPEDRDAALKWSQNRGKEVREVATAGVQPGLTFARGLWFPRLGAIRNPGLLRGLHHLLSSRGVSVVRDRITTIKSAGNSMILTGTGGDYPGETLLVAAGKESPGLLRMLDVSLPVFPVKGEMLLYRAPPGLLRTVVLTGEGYLIPRRDGSILAGSTLEPGVDSSVPSRAAGEALHRQACAMLPELADCPLQAQWAGVRPGSDNGIPWISPVPGCDGVWVATGHYRNGLVSAPATATLVADLMTGTTPSLDPAPYAVGGCSPG